MSWNIQGLDESVIDDQMFNACLDNSDIIVLTETWLSEKCEFRNNDFYVYHNIRPQNPKARRPSGGLCVMIRNSLRSNKKVGKGIKFVRENEYSIWMMIDKKYFNIKEDIFLGELYIPNSTYYKSEGHKDPFLELEKDISHFTSLGNIVLMGDFNARTGIKPDFCDPQIPVLPNVDNASGSRVISTLEQIGRVNRNSEDLTVNKFGVTLLNLCIKSDLRILNGRSIGDLRGAYTSYQYNGKSVVDYILVSEDLLTHADNLHVSEPGHLSDHSFLTTTLNIPTNKPLTNIMKSAESQRHVHTTNIPFKLKWDGVESTKQFKQAIESQSICKKISEFIVKPFHAENVPVNTCCKYIN